MDVICAPSPEMLILLTRLESLKRQNGAKWCRKSGIGPIREALGSPAIVFLDSLRSPDAARLHEARRDAAGVLAATCRACGRCKWAGK